MHIIIYFFIIQYELVTTNDDFIIHVTEFDICNLNHFCGQGNES